MKNMTKNILKEQYTGMNNMETLVKLYKQTDKLLSIAYDGDNPKQKEILESITVEQLEELVKLKKRMDDIGIGIIVRGKILN